MFRVRCRATVSLVVLFHSHIYRLFWCVISVIGFEMEIKYVMMMMSNFLNYRFHTAICLNFSAVEFFHVSIFTLRSSNIFLFYIII